MTSSVLNRFNVLERQTEDRRLEKEIKGFQINWEDREDILKFLYEIDNIVFKIQII